jgi:hypothetical protein
MKNDALTLRLPAALVRALNRLARSRGLPRSQLVREAIAGYLEPSPSAGPPVRRQATLTVRELAHAWSAIPRLAPDDTESFSRDVARSREALTLPDDLWE